MQTKLLTLLCASAALLASGARAQDTTIATPSSPAPAVQQGASQQQATPAASQPQAQASAQPQVAPAPNQIIYAPRLPNPGELTSAAAAQGQSVEQIIQTSSQITVVYRTANGQVNTVAYQLLPTAGAATATVVSPAPTVVYQTAPRTVYYRSYDPFWDDYWYPPVSLNFGFGYYHGWGDGYRGGYRGGFHGGGHHWR